MFKLDMIFYYKGSICSELRIKQEREGESGYSLSSEYEPLFHCDRFSEIDEKIKELVSGKWA